MLQSVDLLTVQRESSDQPLLRAYLQQLVGQPFLHFRFSYGDELSLHFGSPRSYSSRRLKHLQKGSCIVAARASNWFLGVTDPPATIMGTSGNSTSLPDGIQPVSKQRLETSSFVKQGARILAADPIVYASASHAHTGFALVLFLSDGATFFICPSLDDPVQEDDGVSDWEVFTPHQRCIEVGPGVQWSYVNTCDKSAA